MHDQCQKEGCNFKQADIQSIIGCVQWGNIISKGIRYFASFSWKFFEMFITVGIWSKEMPQQSIMYSQWFVLCNLTRKNMKKFKPHNSFLRAKKFFARWARLLATQRDTVEFKYFIFFAIHGGSNKYENLCQQICKIFFGYFSPAKTYYIMIPKHESLIDIL